MLTFIGVAVLSILCFEFWKDCQRGQELADFVRELGVLASLNSELQLTLARAEEMKANLLPYASGILPQLIARWNDLITSDAVSVQAKVTATKHLLNEINGMYCVWKDPVEQEQMKITVFNQSATPEARSHARSLLELLGVTIRPVFSSNACAESIDGICGMLAARNR